MATIQFPKSGGRPLFCPKGHRVTVLDRKKDEVLADLADLDMSIDDISKKYEVSKYQVQAFCKRNDVDVMERAQRIRKLKAERNKAKLPKPVQDWLGNEGTMSGTMMCLHAARLPWNRIAEAIPKKDTETTKEEPQS